MANELQGKGRLEDIFILQILTGLIIMRLLATLELEFLGGELDIL